MSKIKIGNIKGPKGDKGETGAVGPKGEQGIQGPVGPAGGVNSVNGKTGDVDIADALGYTPAGGQGINLFWFDDVLFYRFIADKENNGFHVNIKNIVVGNIIGRIKSRKIEKEKTYTVSGEIRATKDINVRFDICDGSYQIVQITTDNQKFAFSLIAGMSLDFDYGFFDISPNDNTLENDTCMIYVENFKIEPGLVTDPVWTPAPEDIVTKTPYDIFTALDGIPEMHRNLYRGRNLGESTAMSEAHKKAIQDGSFKDLFVGDYWTHNGINYRIADMDYWLRCGDADFTTHHLVIVPDTCLGPNKPMNTTATTDKGYTGSEMYTATLPSIKTEFIDKAFPNMVLSHREYFTNKVTSGHPSGGEWVDATVELMNEIMVYGCPVFMPMNDGATIPTNSTIGNSQLALFRLNPCMIKTRQNYWLRDVVSASHFAFVGANGDVSYVSASYTYFDVRPCFCIGVAPTGDEADDDMEVVSPMQEGDYMEEEFE